LWLGLPALEIPEIKGKINQQDELEVDIPKFTVKNIRTRESFQAKKVPKFMQQMLLDGGLVEYYKKYKQFPWIQR
jgi:3-isopropylmalate dehydratase small subunit